MAGNQNTNAFRPWWGEYVSAAQLPNVAGATFQTSNLFVGAMAFVTGSGQYVCTDATRGAAVWTLLGGASAGIPTMAGALQDLSAVNGYTGLASVYRMPAFAGFLVSCLVRVRSQGTPPEFFVPISTFTTIGGNQGYEFSLAPDPDGGSGPGGDLLISFRATDDQATVLTVSRQFKIPQSDTVNDLGGSWQGKLLLLQGVGGLNGSSPETRLFVNGIECGPPVTSGLGSGYQPSTAIFRVGARPDNSGPASGLAVLGFGMARGVNFNTGDYTNLDLMEHFDACVRAQDFVQFPGTVSFDEFHDGASLLATPQATWTSQVGAVDLTRIGAPANNQQIPAVLW